MALTPRSGSSITPSTQSQTPHDIPNTQSDILPHMPFISDTNLNKFAIDTTQYPNTTKQLVGFMKGKRVVVTYYRLLNREATNNRTNVADLVTSRHVIDTEYQKIINLEITLPEDLEFTSNNAQASMSIKGQAKFYPNMNPNIGDMFLMGMGDGRTGVCRITSVTPMTWRQDRIYIVDFFIPEFVDPVTHAAIEASVTITSIFSKENYLGGTAALLSEQSYLQLAKMKQMRSIFSKAFHQNFFDYDLCSYIRPDTIYDPFVVQFMSNKLTLEDVKVRPKNLLGKIPGNYQKTLWSRLEDRYNTSLNLISSRTVMTYYAGTRTSSFVTELHGRKILSPSNDVVNGDLYIFSDHFYQSQTNSMSNEERLIYNAITQRTAGDLTVLLTDYLDPALTLSLDNQFYKLPLYIHLIDMSLQNHYREIDAPSMDYAYNGGD